MNTHTNWGQKHLDNCHFFLNVADPYNPDPIRSDPSKTQLLQERTIEAPACNRPVYP